MQGNQISHVNAFICIDACNVIRACGALHLCMFMLNHDAVQTNLWLLFKNFFVNAVASCLNLE